MRKISFTLISLCLFISLEAQSKARKRTSRSSSKATTTKTSQTSTENTSNSTETAPSSNSTSSDPLGGIINTVGGLLGGASNGSMSQDKAALGLKEALNLGTSNASNSLGKLDGYLANAAVRILFPPEARKIESTLRQLGMGSICDQVITSVNRSAEAAVVEARPIFMEAITSMSITDAIGILTGGDGSATDYLKRTSGMALMAKFEPVIKTKLDQTNATKYWGSAINTYNQIPLSQKVNPNLSQYVTQKAVDGIFLLIAEEEKNIRANPAARIGGILSDVFGWADKNKK